MAPLIRILILTTLLIPFREPNRGCLEADIVILVDTSSSVAGYDSFIVDAVKAFADRLDMSDYGIRLGMITFDDEAYLLSRLTGDKSEFKKAVDQLYISRWGTTNMSAGLILSSKQFNVDGRQGAKKIIILISDGAPNSQSATEMVALNIRELYNLELCTIAIASGSLSEDFLIEVSSDGCYVSTSYSSLVMTLEQLDFCF